jgi:hypothetical protein
MLPPVQRSFSEHGIEDATGRSCASSRLGSNLGSGTVSNCLGQECLRNRKISSSETRESSAETTENRKYLSRNTYAT